MPASSPTSSPARASTIARSPMPARSRSPSASRSASATTPARRRSASSRSRSPAASTPAAITMSATSASSASRRRARSSTSSPSAAPATRPPRSARSSAPASPATRSSTRSRRSSTPISRCAQARTRISSPPIAGSARRRSRRRSMAPLDALALAVRSGAGAAPAEAAALNARYGRSRRARRHRARRRRALPRPDRAGVELRRRVGGAPPSCSPRSTRDVPVIFLDTGRLFAETLEYRTLLTERLGLRDVRTVSPDPERLAAKDPHRALWMTNPDLCCHIRKTEPLQRALAGFDAWFTGRKRFQNAIRADLPLFEADGERIKVNPLAGWSADGPEGLRAPPRPARAPARRQGLSRRSAASPAPPACCPARTSAPAAGAASTRSSAASTFRWRPTAAAFECSQASRVLSPAEGAATRRI